MWGRGIWEISVFPLNFAINLKLKYFLKKIKIKEPSDDAEGWNREGGKEAQEGRDMGTCVFIWLIRFVVQQKLTQSCEAIILQ